MITDARQIFYAAATYENHAMLLKVVADARNVGRDFFAVGQANARDFAQRRIRLLGRHRLDLRAEAAALWVAGNLKGTRRQVGMSGFGTRLDDAERAGLDLLSDLRTALTDQLTDSRQPSPRTQK